MQQNMRWWAKAAATATILTSVLSACSSGNTSESSPASSSAAATETAGGSASATASAEASNNEHYTINWGIHFQAPGVIADTRVQKELEKRYNVTIKPVKITDASIAGGEVPDVFTLSDPSAVAAYQTQGVLMPIERSLIGERLPEYEADIQSVPGNLFAPATFDDKLWAIPMFVMLRGYDFAGLWRTDWLKKVGIEKTPETLEEFEKAVYAFAKNDPDGNGKNDTYGLTGTMTTTWSSGFYNIFGAYGVEPTMWHVRDGKVVNGSVMPETKEALATLRKWYADKVIDPEFITDTQESYRTKLFNGRIGFIEETIGRLYREDASTIASMKEINASATLAPGVNPTGPGGSGSWSWGSKSNYVVFGSQMAKDQGKLDRILQIMRDYSADRELYLLLNQGYEGEQWKYVSGTSGPTEFLDGWAKVEDRDQTGARMFALGAINTNAMRADLTDPDLTAAIQKYGAGDNWTDATYFMVLPSEGMYKADLTLLMQRTFAEIITGQKSLDDYDAYVKQWYAKGGQKLTDEANALYATLK
ncbi:type 2 periplasmic-binding domain-containing protein [Cohnella rhizosphaerae]|uniref:Extracellular solute-binding protein n=1 Tax=Cohnella rhizosphaerae TaxID=1457232 RepID=A0A9X4KSV7_9BACL|nr:extracellular solute-binding protein [Cohnella rhizosphaerae]MDG0810501.1 extracellular solute-binding protein [Cohnella rhizosphaerae]